MTTCVTVLCEVKAGSRTGAKLPRKHIIRKAILIQFAVNYSLRSQFASGNSNAVICSHADFIWNITTHLPLFNKNLQSICIKLI